MFQLKRILFPIDFSDRGLRAVGYVETLALHFEAELILLHVVEPPTYNTSLADWQDLRVEGFDKFLGTRLKRLHVERIVEYGEPARKIVKCAASRHADLIAIPTQGMGIYRRLILGSTSAKVLHDADCPVWTTAHLEHAPPLDDVRHHRILCAVDLKPHCTKVLEWADRFARSYQADLTLLHVGTAESLQALADLRHTTGANAAVRLEHGDPAKTVARVAEELNADLLVIGRGAEPGMLGRLEAAAYAIIRQSPCPVVSV